MKPTKNGDGTLRHDLAPLSSRIPALAAATSATWCSGTLGDGRVPGPSTYWIDAVVALPAPLADELRGELALSPATAPPSLEAPARSALPTEELLAGSELDARFSAGSWRSTAFLTKSGSTLVLTIIGGN
jgi:hypothetical protein